jgi:Putative auto-transporter adhesin, head GIN domain
MNPLSEYKRLLLLLTAILAIGCESDCYKNNGSFSKESRQISNFHSIQVKNNISVILQKSNLVSGIQIEAGTNLLSKIKTTVQDSVLILENTNACNWVRDQRQAVKIYINYQQLRYIDFRSFGTLISLDTVSQRKLEILHQGQNDLELKVKIDTLNITLKELGDVKLSGTCKTLALSQSGYGFFRCRNLVADQCEIIHNGEGNVEIAVLSKLKVDIKNVGNIIYFGQPTIIESIFSSKGQLMVGSN